MTESNHDGELVSEGTDRKLTEWEKGVAKSISKRRRKRPAPPHYQLTAGEGGTPALGFEDEHDGIAQLRMQATTGMKNTAAVSLLVEQILRLSADDIQNLKAYNLNRAIAMFDEVAPSNGVESMLAAQMVAVHFAAMKCFSRAALDGQTFAGRELNLKFGAKMSRLFAQQMQTMDKHRRNGQQKVTVEHVHVNAGGQAIVGNVAKGGNNAENY